MYNSVFCWWSAGLVQSEQGYSASYMLILVVEVSKKFCVS